MDPTPASQRTAAHQDPVYWYNGLQWPNAGGFMITWLWNDNSIHFLSGSLARWCTPPPGAHLSVLPSAWSEVSSWIPVHSGPKEMNKTKLNERKTIQLESQPAGLQENKENTCKICPSFFLTEQRPSMASASSSSTSRAQVRRSTSIQLESYFSKRPKKQRHSIDCNNKFNRLVISSGSSSEILFSRV